MRFDSDRPLVPGLLLLLSPGCRLGELAAARSSARAALLAFAALELELVCWVEDVRGGATGGSFLRRLELDLSWSEGEPATATGEANAVREVIGDDWDWSVG
jgi:hypothetical protein